MERKDAKGPAVNLSTSLPPFVRGFVGPEGPLVRTFAKLSAESSRRTPFLPAASSAVRVFKGRTKATGNCCRLFRRYGRFYIWPSLLRRPTLSLSLFFSFLFPSLSILSLFCVYVCMCLSLSLSLLSAFLFLLLSTISRVGTYRGGKSSDNGGFG